MRGQMRRCQRDGSRQPPPRADQKMRADMLQAFLVQPDNRQLAPRGLDRGGKARQEGDPDPGGDIADQRRNG